MHVHNTVRGTLFGFVAVSLACATASAATFDLYTVPGIPLDTNTNQILYAHNLTNGTTNLTVETLSTSTNSVLLNFFNQGIWSGFLTSHGAIFQASSIASNPNAQYHVYESRDGSLLDLGPTGPNSGDSELTAAGDYAAWNTFLFGAPTTSNRPLTTRNLATGTNTTVAPQSGGSEIQVMPTGDLYFTGTSTSDYNIYQYHAGTVTNLTVTAPNPVHIEPASDGSNVVFLSKTAILASTEDLVLRDSSGNFTTLVPGFTGGDQTGSAYAINNGWIAYQIKTPSNGYQIWERSPAGVLTSLSFRSLKSGDLKVGSDGSVAWTSINFDNTKNIYIESPGDSGPTAAVSNVQSDTLFNWDGTNWNVVVDLPEPIIGLALLPLILLSRKRRIHQP
ncbi:MAG TPA: hypothetical protein VFE58_17990 [Tepidisphaeraceae bacterium]|jgi:hypothetical protein|nr:hypothetical protein [Tepidisphaeraceae bacterium]